MTDQPRIIIYRRAPVEIVECNMNVARSRAQLATPRKPAKRPYVSALATEEGWRNVRIGALEWAECYSVAARFNFLDEHYQMVRGRPAKTTEDRVDAEADLVLNHSANGNPSYDRSHSRFSRKTSLAMTARGG